MNTVSTILQNQNFYDWVVFPILIFIARMCDVSLGTLRSVLVAKGKKDIVPFIGFFEVLIWLFAISQILQNLSNFMCYIAFAGGYATGIYVGLVIEEKLAMGTQLVNIITNQNCDDLIASLKQANYGLTLVEGQGARGPVKMIFTVVKRKEVFNVIQRIRLHNPNAFYSVEDVKGASQVDYRNLTKGQDFFKRLFFLRKEK